VKLGQAVVLHAKRLSATESPVLKWRGVALDRFDGLNWWKTNTTHIRIPASRDRIEDTILDPQATVGYAVGSVDGDGELVRYLILLEPMQNASALFGPYRIREIAGRRSNMQVVDRDGDDSVYMRATGVRVQYEVLSELPPRPRPLPAGADGDAGFPPAIEARYLQLPENLDPRVRELAADIVGGAVGAMDKAARVESHLKANYA
jgi:transglutaminase-like putative cysteine protease